MKIRTYVPGDEEAQAAIYNEAANQLPKFKPASVEEIRRRCRAADFDPTNRLFAEVDGRPAGYIAFNPNGRLGYPWCLPGNSGAAEALLRTALERLKAKGAKKALAPYRGDWASVKEFFLERGFALARHMVNFVLDQVDMPTRPSSRKCPLSPLSPDDIPALRTMGNGVLQPLSNEGLCQYFFHNPYFAPASLFVARGRNTQEPLAVGILVANNDYANPHHVDSDMPCFRLGAFGSEGMQVKRINGLFSFLARDAQSKSLVGLDLLGHAASTLEDTDTATLAAQVPSDALDLRRFYESYFRRQGSFSVFERNLT
jgi:hypothetical protein